MATNDPAATAEDGQARLEGFLLAWHESFEGGREAPAAELCADCPELLPELERQIAALKRLEALAGCAPTARSTSSAKIFSPPELMVTPSRPSSRIRPSSSTSARSPGTENRSPAIIGKVRAVFSGSPR